MSLPVARLTEVAPLFLVPALAVGCGSTADRPQASAPSRVGVSMVDLYRDVFSRQWGYHCDFEPSCSEFGRQAMMDYFQHCVLRAFPDDPPKMPPTMHYFMKINEILRGMTKETLSDKSILIGNADQITETLKRVEAAGIDEVILYFNVGRKPHALVKDQMHKFMEEIAPAFEGSHKLVAAE